MGEESRLLQNKDLPANTCPRTFIFQLKNAIESTPPAHIWNKIQGYSTSLGAHNAFEIPPSSLATILPFVIDTPRKILVVRNGYLLLGTSSTSLIKYSFGTWLRFNPLFFLSFSHWEEQRLSMAESGLIHSKSQRAGWNQWKCSPKSVFYCSGGQAALVPKLCVTEDTAGLWHSFCLWIMPSYH